LIAAIYVNLLITEVDVYSVIYWHIDQFLAECRYITFVLWHQPSVSLSSVCYLSSLCDIRAPTGVQLCAFIFAPSCILGTRTVCVKILEIEGVLGDREVEWK